MTRTRVIVATILIPPIIGVLYIGGIPWLVGVLGAAVLGWLELAHILQREHFTVDRYLGLFFVVGAVVEAYLHSLYVLRVDLLQPLLAALIILSLIWALYNKGEHPTADWGVTVASAIYLGFTISFFVALRQRPDGFHWAVTAFVLAWACDGTSYFVGRLFGRHKLWPRISPKKTWEGVVGGAMGSVVAALLLGGWLLGLTFWQSLLLGLLAAVAAPFGDLAESFFKRRANVKDSSQLIPGHGGILDRLDSLLFVFPVVTYFAMIVSGL